MLSPSTTEPWHWFSALLMFTIGPMSADDPDLVHRDLLVRVDAHVRDLGEVPAWLKWNARPSPRPFGIWRPQPDLLGDELDHGRPRGPC